MGLATATWQADNDPASPSADGRLVVLRVRNKASGFPEVHVWDRNTSQVHRLPGECGSTLQPVYSLSDDGNRIVVVCSKGLGHSIRAWNLGSGEQIPLMDADFGLARGAPVIGSEGVALSPDGRHLGVALLNLSEALVATPLLVPLEMSRSDLRLWNLEDGRGVVTVPIDDLVATADYFRGVGLAFSPDSAILAVAGRRLRSTA